MIQYDRYGMAKLDVNRSAMFIEHAKDKASTDLVLHDSIIDVLIDNEMLSIYNLLICRVPRTLILTVARTHNLIPDIGNMTDNKANSIITDIDSEYGDDVLAQAGRFLTTGNLEHANDPDIVKKMSNQQALPIQRWMRNLLVAQDTHPPMDFPKGRSDANENFGSFGGHDREHIHSDAGDYGFFGYDIGRGSDTDDSIDGNRQGGE